MPRKVPYPNSRQTRVKEMFVQFTRLSCAEVVNCLLMEQFGALDEPPPMIRRSLYATVTSMICKLLKSEYLECDDTVNDRGGRYYKLKLKQNSVN